MTNKEDLIQFFNKKDYRLTINPATEEIGVAEYFNYIDKNGDNIVLAKQIKDLNEYNLIVSVKDFQQKINRIGLLINNKQVFLLEFLGKGKVRPYIEDLNHLLFYYHYAEIAELTEEGAKFIGKVWHRYIKEVVKVRERLPEFKATYIPSLMIPIEEIRRG